MQCTIENFEDKLKKISINKIISISASLVDLPQLTKIIGNFLQAGDWLFLDGDLGAGKTALAKEISIFFGVKNYFTSPTFSILNSESVEGSGSIQKILHLDLYRLKSGKELCFIGLEEEFKVKSTLAIFEWPDVIEKEEWEYFFTVTTCAKPKRIIVIKIEELSCARNYEFSLLNLYK